MGTTGREGLGIDVQGGVHDVPFMKLFSKTFKTKFEKF